jgi:hypothetical protein
MKIRSLSIFWATATLIGCAGTQGARVESCKAATDQCQK